LGEFLLFMMAGVRHGEALGLRWRTVLLADPDEPVMRIEETFVRHAIDTPKSQAGNRTIALGSRLAAELFEHRGRSPYKGEDERVFANPRTGTPSTPIATRRSSGLPTRVRGLRATCDRPTISGTRRSRTRQPLALLPRR
jgi:integrase